jgi:hypothetical protein
MENNDAQATGWVNRTIKQESIWQTLAGCGLFWAGLLALWWML